MAENKTFPRVRAILMPLLDGGSLHDALRRAAETENPTKRSRRGEAARADARRERAEVPARHGSGFVRVAFRARTRRAADAREPGFAIPGFRRAPRRQAEERAA